MLNFSLNSHLHLHWDQWPGFGECFLEWRVLNFYLTTWTSGSNESLLNAWLKPNLFISRALLALAPSLGTLPGPVWSFCHMLVNNIQGLFEPDPHASAKWFHLWQPPASARAPWGQAISASEDANCCKTVLRRTISVQGLINQWAMFLYWKVSVFKGIRSHHH